MAVCKCGKRKSRYANECTKCHKRHMDEIHAEAQRIVQGGQCPKCGSPLRRNSAMAGWYQCVCYGEPDFRLPEYRNLPHCSFQCFTE